MVLFSSLLNTLAMAFFAVSNFFSGGNNNPNIPGGNNNPNIPGGNNNPNIPGGNNNPNIPGGNNNPNIPGGNNTRYPMCVVGAGISGLNLASLLQNKGHLVHVYEKLENVGGKIITYREEGIQVDMAALLFTMSNTHLIKKIEELKLTTVSFNESDAALFDAESGKVFPPPNFTPEQFNQLRDAIIRYTSYYSEHSQDLEYGYTKASPEVFVSISDWLDKRNLQILKPIFSLLITVEGYGALEDTPAIYALRLAHSSVIQGLGSFTGSFMSVKEGFDVMVNRMASSLKVFLNKEVLQVFREKDHLRLVLNDKHPRGFNYQICKNVFLAFPPLLPNLDRIIVDLTNEEKDVLKNVKIHRYTSAAHYIPNLNHSLYYDPNPKGNGEVTAFVKQDSLARKGIYSSYSWIRGDFDSTPSETDLIQIENKRQELLKNIDGNSTTFFRSVFEYFPHVASKALQDGFYKKFDALQGKGGIFYASTLLTFESMNMALEMTETLVDKYFGH